jgi:general secretion pathway protein A
MHPAKSAPLAQSPHSVFANDELRRPAFVNYFGLRENPFRSTSDPRYLLLTDQSRRALDGLIGGINARAGLLVLTGEVGAGKTVLLNSLLDLLRQRGTPRAFIFNSHLETDELFEMVLADFGVPADTRTQVRPGVRLQQWLLDRYRANANPVLIVDEAQGLKVDVLEAIRMLLNLESGGEKLVQIVLSGQPEFDTKINLPELRQLRQRIALRYRLGPLTLDETCLYIEHRLRVAGSTGDAAFEPETLAAVHYYAHGTPRVINALCEQALMKACAERNRPVHPETIEEVARQFQVDGHKPIGPPVQLGDLMLMNAIAARSKRADAMLAMSASARPSAATSQPEPSTAQQPASREPLQEPIHSPLHAAESKPRDAAPTPATPMAARAPVFTKLAADFLSSAAQTSAPPAVPKEPSPEPIRLPAGAASPKNFEPAPAPAPFMAASAPVLTKLAADFLSSTAAQTPAPSTVPKEPPPEPIRLPAATASPRDSMPAIPIAASAPLLTELAADFLSSPVQTPAPSAVPKEPSPTPIRLPTGTANPKDSAPATASAPVLPKPPVDFRSPARTPTPPSVHRAAVMAPRPSRMWIYSELRAQISLFASLSSIERAASNWLRWLRQPIGSSRGAVREKAR